MELDKQTLGTQLSELKNSMEQIKTDKQTLYQGRFNVKEEELYRLDLHLK